jgi:carbon monoxide dehydrogenase subunit G
MELTNDFLVDVPVPEAWKVLTDVERIAPLLPGAQLQEVQDDEYRGIVKVKVGPITAQYKGTATFVERDEAAGKVALKASGRDTRGQGNASALITATMKPEGNGTKVTVVTDLTITGKVAQFGRGVLAEVSAKLLGQFVDALHENIAQGDAAPPPPPPAGEAAPAPSPTAKKAAAAKRAATATSDMKDAPAAGDTQDAPVAEEPPSSGPRKIYQPEPEPVDLLEVAGASTAKRVIPLVVVGLLILLVLRRRRSRRREAAVLAEVLS